MSKTVDQRVVEMQFDNRHFEKNVSKTMSTLEKLKQSLKLPDASKSLDGINQAAKNVNLSGIGRAVDTVQTKFSALEVMGVTALANITNSAVNAGKRIVKSLTIDPVTTGFQEYELKMNSLRTIMASTGESLDVVNGYLSELNEYSDQTIYSFSDMTQNIGKFTNAGVKLKDAVAAIKGISNEAAVSGANANEASRAMYNFAQALSAGYVKLIDWKSIENANMATVEFKNELIKTALELRTVTKGADGMYKTLDGNLFNATKNFNEVLQDQWMTSEVLIETLKRYADEATDIGGKATEAATKVRTLTQLMDTLKESAQSGWARTWELIVGDYYEAEDVFTKLSEGIGGVIEKMSEIRNNFLEDVLASPWEKLEKRISSTGINLDEFKDKLKKTARAHNKELDKMSDEELTFDKMLQDGIVTKELVIETLNEYVDSVKGIGESSEDMTKKLEHFQKVVSDVWNGNYKNGVERIKALTDAGYDYAEVQELVNKTVDGHKLTLEDLSETQLKAVGYTDEQVKAIKLLGEEAKEAGTPLNELINSMNKPSGRMLLLDSFKNILEYINNILKPIQEAFGDTFGDVNIADGVRTLIEEFHNLTTKLEVSETAANNLKTIFEALFATFKIGNLIVSKSLVSGLKILDAVLGLFNTDILGAAAYVADLILQFDKWLETNVKVADTVDKIAEIIVGFINGIKKCINAFKGLPQVAKIIENVEQTVASFFSSIGTNMDATAIEKFVTLIDNAFSKAETWIKSLEGSENLGRDIVSGLIKGLEQGVRKVVETVSNFATTIIEQFCAILGIASPSKVFIALGGFIIGGLVMGLKSGFPEVWASLSGFASKCIEFLSNINYGQFLAAGLSVGMLLIIKKVLGIAEMFGSAAKGFGKMMSSVGNMCDAVADRINPKKSKIEQIIDLLKSLAVVFLALTASAYILGKMEPDELVKAGIALGVMTVIVGALVILSSKMKGFGDDGMSFKPLLVMVGAILMMAMAFKQLSKIHLDDVPAILAAMLIMVGGVSAILFAYGKLAKGKSARYMDKAGKMMVKMSLALLIMVGVFKLVSKVTDNELWRGLAVVAGVELLFMAMTAIVKGSGKNATKIGSMLLQMSLAMAVMIGVIKLASKLDGETVIKGTAVIVLIEGMFAAMVKIAKSSGKNAHKIGTMMLLMSMALGVMVLVVKKAGELSPDQIQNGLVVVGVLELFMAGLIQVTKKAGKDVHKVGIMLIAVSAALLILSGVMYLLAKLATDNAKGMRSALAVVSVLEILMMGLIKSTEKSKKCMGTLIMLTFVIATLTIAVTALSFIPAEKLAAAAGAITAVLGMFALLMGVTKYTKNTKDMRKTLLYMVGIVAAIALIIAALSYVIKDTESALVAAGAISMVMLAFATSLAIIGKTNRILKTVSDQIMPMLAVVLVLGLVLAALSHCIKDTESALTAAIALSILLTAFSAALVLLNFVGPNAVASVPAVQAMGLVVAELAIILGVMGALDITMGIETALSMSTLLLAMSAACALVSFIPLGAAVQGALGLSAFVGIIGTVIAALGGLSRIPGFNELMADGGGVLASIGYSLGNFVGSILGGFSAGAMSGLPEIGTHLSNFMTNAQPFLDGLGAIDESATSGVKTLAETIMILTGADLLQGITGLLGFGDASLSGFGEQLGVLGSSMKEFVNNLGTFGPEQVVAVTCASMALKNLAQAASEIPNDGGWLGTIFGENSISSFGPKLPGLALNLSAFVKNLGTFGEEQVTAATNAGEALAALANAAADIPNEGGWLATLFGENGISAFAPQLPALGAYIKSFVQCLGPFGNEELESVKNAGKAMSAIADAAADIPNDGGLWGKIFGENSLSSFASELPGLGENIGSFVRQISGVGAGVVASAGAVLNAIVELVNIDFNSSTAGLAEFCEKMSTLATDAVDKFAEGLSSRVSKNKAKDAVKEVVTAAAEKAESWTCRDAFYDAGKYLVDGLAAGIKDSKSTATAAAQDVATAVETIIRDAWEVNSPSKLFYGIALGIGEGVTNALDDSGSSMMSSAGTFANKVTRGFSAALVRIDDAIHSDIDTQPTIRPVLDLSNVESGVGTLNGMLGNKSVGVNAHIGAISAMMGSRGQNGTNGDVVNAINKLRGDLGKVGNTYNNINGVTYDDGSNVSDAVRVLVRAAKIERRV